MDCVVTGGAGFIGSNLVDALVARGDHVAVIDDLSSGKLENLEGALASGARLYELDVRDARGVARVFAEVGPRLVFHLAAQIDVRRSVSDPAFDADVNVLGAINLLAAAHEHGVARVVNSSTGGGLYGDAELLPTPEEHPIHPLAPYGQSKLAAEGYFELYTRLHGLSTVSLRYGNVYGPRQDVQGEAGVVAIFCGCLLEGRTPCVYGDGRQTRDWVDVADVVRANLLAAGSGVSGPINIAGGEETSVLDLVAALRAAGAARELTLAEPTFLPARAGEVSRSRLDITRARRELGWEPSVRLPDGLDRILSAII
ncbi:MAG: GDP-mannose 4,6-dehydratase [Acidobacteriota bacterium]|nr:GDP-mannose 4,6-dehydratase [Acidobacteriota bacterium]